MAGTKPQRSTGETVKARHGEDFFKRIGSVGGRAQTPTKGFGTEIPCECSIIDEPHFTKNCAGKVGGMRSKRRPQAA